MTENISYVGQAAHVAQIEQARIDAQSNAPEAAKVADLELTNEGLIAWLADLVEQADRENGQDNCDTQEVATAASEAVKENAAQRPA